MDNTEDMNELEALKLIESKEAEVDKENENEFVEAGLPYVKLSKPLPNYKFK